MKPFAALLTGISFLSLPAAAEEAALLSAEKQTLLREERNRYEAEHEKLRNDWIAPLNLNGVYSRDKSGGGVESETKRLSASISQDIFRSGGISYQIRYADTKKGASEIEWQRQIAGFNGTLFDALLSYRKNRYELEQSEKKLANHDIEIFIKRQLYESGKTDITELNNALMQRSGEQKNHASLLYALVSQKLEISKLSDVDPEVSVPPSFELVPEQEYLQGHLDIRYARAQSETYGNLYRVTQSGYLPSVALEGSAGYQDYNPQNLGGYEGSFYSGGVALKLPLSYTAFATVEEARATYLKQAADTADREREARASYAQSLALIESYRRHIEIAAQNLSLYDELIAVVRAGVDAGSKTGYDLKTLENTRSIEEDTIKINEINIQRELAKLYFAIHASKEMR